MSPSWTSLQGNPPPGGYVTMQDAPFREGLSPQSRSHRLHRHHDHQPPLTPDYTHLTSDHLHLPFSNQVPFQRLSKMRVSNGRKLEPADAEMIVAIIYHYCCIYLISIVMTFTLMFPFYPHNLSLLEIFSLCLMNSPQLSFEPN